MYIRFLDSGGPLVINEGRLKVQIGLVSYGSSDGCAVGDPAGFTRLGNYLSWISKETGIVLRP